MSFILDALKKSESERQRKGTPGIADVPQGKGGSGNSTWIWIVVALLAVNFVVLLGLMLRSDTSPAVTPELRPADTAAKIAPEPVAESFSEIVADAKRSQPATVASEPPHTLPPRQHSDAKPATNVSRATVVDGPDTFNELRSNGSLQLPDLHLDIHVYSATPAERFVFINMSRYRENATLDEGPQIREITPEGVILEHQGQRFLLPRE
ncbi:MAG: general secretion pathway protein GspB [Gammaproteobacteria bacterium]|nr:general secretion pathway protein GspB [Gammaproteobacteria bacterium]MDH4313477.1 general secretion pathway protein GspB [Gammaproteobacteria bacterium]MDH5213053.1 general secretion pathway protein GspB [Gammaproteobacteria bacterium]MDH5501530.1 general secretion pathway protein GspB [Gammaproteobacteria bacterium]